MKFTKTIVSITFSAVLLIACNSNNSTNASMADATNNSSASQNSGDDYYYELTTKSSGKNISINEVTKMYVSSKGDMRSEMEIHSSANGNKISAPTIIIAHADKPGESFDIDDSAKTYTINHIDSGDSNTGEKITSTATKIGDEKIMGFNCVHARVISKKTMGSFYSSVDTIDLWKSNDVPQQPAVKKLMTKAESGISNSMYSTETTQQLKQMRCDGMTVKMTIGSKDHSMILQLTKVERRDIPANMFAIPAGYKEVKE
ncbi:MAG: DUF4412 domain-containing protein [Ferruginibacter sp.]